MGNIKFILKYLLKFKKILILIVILTILSSFINLIMPYITKKIFDSGIVPKNVNFVISLSLLLIGIYTIKFFLSYFSRIFYTKSSVKFTLEIKKDLYTHLLRLPMGYFDKHKKGYLLSRIDETNSLSVFFSSAIFDLISASITALGAFSFIFYKNMLLAFVTLIFLPIFYFLTKISLKKISLSSKELFEVTASVKGKIQESIEGIQELKHLNNEDNTAMVLSHKITEISSKTVENGKFAAMGSESIAFLMNISQVCITLTIGIFIINDQLTIGDYVALTQYSLLLFAPIQLLATFSMTIQPGIIALQRVNEILEVIPEDHKKGTKINTIDKIEFKNVSFIYENSNKAVFEDISFVINKGEKVGIEGINGSGKSTIIKLLLGLYSDYSGEILINDINLKDINIKSVRDRVGLVSQNIVLFSGTLLDNIKMANPLINKEQLDKIMNIFNDKIFEDIDPKAIILDEKGNNLSGGQKQKIAILRAFAKNPDILVFDEATSNIDNDSTNLLNTAIQNIFNQKTCIIVSHQKYIANLDKILEIKDGYICEKGFLIEKGD
ncbi:ABC transporter ATP-binding protein [Peribacillus tepidiphilus]|uniref:ABC transporter ATP-binding protein n=1 Tax=Peribacillus tepidiphilus TaxID=2652445 RepID=UPI00177D2943|nr:ABC transporter ATP-binding protein [Peribacillus tepidiphilus]